MSSKLKNTVSKLVREFGYYDAKKILGISFTDLAKITGERITYDLANDILIEGIANKTIPTEYKEFKLRRSFDSIVYWDARIKTGRFSPEITEYIDIVATPFWDGGESTPVELDWYGLVKDKSEKAIVETFGSEENYFVQLTDRTSFRDTNDLFRWYEEYYLPTVYEIITDNYIPRAQQVCEDKLDEKFGTSSLNENRTQTIFTFDKSQLKIYNSILNKKLPEIIKAFHKIEIDEAVYNKSSNYFTQSGKIYFDEDWIYHQFRKYNYSKPLPPYDELSFGEIMSNEDSWYKEFDGLFRTLFSSIMGILEPKYTSYSWLTVYPIEEETTDLQEQIRKVLREELYSPSGKEYTPGKFVVHTSNPVWRENIELTGLQVSVGDCYQGHVGGDVECKPSIFATDSLKKKHMFDSSYDDDIWVINTECAGVTWYKDKHFEGGDYPHIVTFDNISPDCLKLIHKGTGKNKW